MRAELQKLIERAGAVGNVMVWLAYSVGVGADARGASAIVGGLAEHPWCAGFDGEVTGIERAEYEDLLARGARDMGRKPARPPTYWNHGMASLVENWRSRRLPSQHFGHVIAVGPAYETNVALPVTARKSSAIGQVSEMDQALPITPIKGSLNVTLDALVAEGAGVVGDVELLLGAAVIVLGDSVEKGQIVEAVTIGLDELLDAFARDSSLMFNVDPRKMEEIIAGAWKARGDFDEVILTPLSGDGGLDIVATQRGRLRVRIINQVKRYAPDRVVTAEEVRAMVGVLDLEGNVSKGYVSTTARFAPGIAKDSRLARLMPHRLELRDGSELLPWLFESRPKKA